MIKRQSSKRNWAARFAKRSGAGPMRNKRRESRQEIKRKLKMEQGR